METRAGYVMVGGFVVALFLGALGLAIWFGDLRLARAFADYRIQFDGSVAGLSVGSPVRYRGVPIGAVTDIHIDRHDVERITVWVEIEADMPMKSDMYATLESQGLTGVGFIQIQGGTRAALPLPESEDGRPPLIPSRASRLERVFQTAPEIAGQLVALTARLQEFLGDDNRDAVRDILTNLATVTAVMANRTGEIEAAVVDGAAAASEVREAMSRFTPLIDDLTGHFATITDELSVTLATLRGTAVGLDAEAGMLAQRIGAVAVQMEAVVADARPGMKDFSDTGLYELTQFLMEARELVGNLDRLVRQIDRDPSRILFGDRDGQVETR